MGQKKLKLTQILDRDDGRCGIHLGGCGKEFNSHDNIDIGHIIPKTSRIQPTGHDQLLPPTEMRKTKQWLISIGDMELCREIDNLNIQPMHTECNQRMGSVWPPAQIVKHCECCEYMYMANRNTKTIQSEILRKLEREGRNVIVSNDPTGKISATVDGVNAGITLPTNPIIGERFYLLANNVLRPITGNYELTCQLRPVLPRDGESDQNWKWTAESVSLLRQIKIGVGDIKIYACCAFSNQRIKLKYESPISETPILFVWWGYRRDGRAQAGVCEDGKMGNLLSVDHMLHHNLSSGFILKDMWNDWEQLSQEESTILERLPWGSGWDGIVENDENDWFKKEWDEFGFLSVLPKSKFAMRKPEFPDFSIYINPQCQQHIRVVKNENLQEMYRFLNLD